MNRSDVRDVVIVGAGIGATVIESVREIRPLGVGINVQPHAVRELIELGLGDELAATSIPTAEHVYLDRLGHRIFAEPRGLAAGYHWPQYSVHRGELQMLLLSAVHERLGPDAIRTGTRLKHFHQTPTAVHAQVIDRITAVVEEIEAGALIGADGLNSTVRAPAAPR